MATDTQNPNVPRSLKSLFQPPRPELCQRCGDRVYQVEKVGPVNEVIFHKQCFKCCKCGQHLTLRTYFTNQVDLRDSEIYCNNHTPKNVSAGYDARAIGIKGVLSHGTGKERGWTSDQVRMRGQAPKIGSDAMHIMHPVAAQNELKRKYRQSYSRHHYPAYLSRAKEILYDAQEELEKKQREEEDSVITRFVQTREAETENLKKEIDSEWEVKLKELTEKFDTENKERKYTKKGGGGGGGSGETKNYEKEKEELKRNMTVKLKEKQEAMTLRIQKEEQQNTSSMVQKHSHQMLELLKSKEDDLKQQLEMELKQNGSEEGVDAAAALEEAMAAISLPTELPPPHAPTCRKRDLYLDPSVFTELDEDVFKVAEREQSTFTDLVKQLTHNCITDLQKARAIFRWITVKDLNTLDFSETGTGTDTPMGLLRGIKFGTETYHTLFMRLCSYAGLACVEIKGHSKSVGYEPGMKIREDSFQNTWNAVLINGDWWPVQCNWGARHLVLNKDVQDRPQIKQSKKQDKIRYQYDEHYFLTDPDEFIQEFWAQDPDWQLMEKRVTLEEFESMPFVRSVFFHYGLEFDKPMKSVIYTDNKGGTEVKIQVPKEFEKDLVFHYQIRFADRERRNETEFRGAKLERFVFHSLVDEMALFSVHVPTPAAYFLEIFANKIDESNKIGDDPNATMMPFRLKCACKFKIVCEELVGKMHPLPNCASGEWGPSKGKRHFGLVALTHSTGVINVENYTEVRFKLPRNLHFLCKLRMNGVEDSVLETCVAHALHDDTLTVKVTPPKPGQYGLDVYARPEDAADSHTLAHACKYLLNCTEVKNPVDITVSKVNSSSTMSKEKWGPSPHFDELGMKTLTHREATIQKTDPGPLVIEIALLEPLKVNYHLIREPDEDCRDKATVKENGKKCKFTLSLHKAGNYLFAIYARKKKDSHGDMLNVFNYMIKFAPDGETNTMKKKKKGLFK